MDNLKYYLDVWFEKIVKLLAMLLLSFVLIPVTPVIYVKEKNRKNGDFAHYVLFFFVILLTSITVIFVITKITIFLVG